MRLICCHVENFGKLHREDFVFEDNLTSVRQNNGWGKTTLSEFLCAMLYGMPDKSKRKKYLPWQGGNYGGFIEFELSDGKKYRVERYFKKSSTKADPDEFKLIDLQTNTECDRYGQNIGLELFEINAAGYCRSAFINKSRLADDSDIKSADSNGIESVSARLGGLLEAANDIGSYELAVENLDKKRRWLLADKGDGGQITVIENEIARIQVRIDDAKGLIRNAGVQEGKLAQLINELSDLEKTEKILLEESEQAQKYAGLQSIATQYFDYEQKMKAEQAIVAEYSEFFKGNIPNQNELDNVLSLISELEGQKLRLEAIKPLPEEADRLELLAEKHFLDDDTADKCRNLISKLEIAEANAENLVIPSEKITRLTALKQKYPNGIPPEKDIEELKKADNDCQTAEKYKNYTNERLVLAENELVERQAEIGKSNRRKKEKNKRFAFLSGAVGTLGIVATAVGIPSGIALMWIVGIILTVVGIVGAVVFANLKTDSVTDSSEVASLRKMFDENRNELDRCIAELNRILNRCGLAPVGSGYGDTVSRIVADIAEFNTLSREIKLREDERNHNFDVCDGLREKLVAMLGEVEDAEFRTTFDNMMKERTEYNELRKRVEKRRQEANALEQNIRKDEARLNEFFGRWCDVNGRANYRELLRDVNERVRKLKDAADKVELLSDHCKKILAEHPDIGSIHSENCTIDTEDCKKRLDSVRIQLKSKIEERVKLENRINDMYESASDLDTLESENDELKELRETYKLQHKAIISAIKYLEEAKNNLSVRYLKQMNETFGDYMKRLNNVIGENFRVDKNFNVIYDEVGSKREAKQLSDGWRDLVSFLTRLSLICALFPAEKPFLVADDPFANLDTERMEIAKQLLAELSCEYQIIYLTCSDERNIVRNN